LQFLQLAEASGFTWSVEEVIVPWAPDLYPSGQEGKTPATIDILELFRGE
jgi:hypothetical protein